MGAFRRALQILAPFIFSTLMITLIVLSVRISIAQAARNYGPDNDYLADTTGERGKIVKDMIVIQPPNDSDGDLRGKIFNESLSKEFTDKYQQKFGYTEIERVYNSPNRYTYYDDLYGFKGSPQEQTQARRDFADYMLKRLAEYHVDNYTKHSPNAKFIYDTKERLSNLNVEVSRFRFDMNYEIAGNTFELKVKNPYLDLADIKVDMNPATIGPSQVNEATLSLGRPVTKNLYAELHYKNVDGVVQYIARRSINPHLGATATFSTFVRDYGITPRQSLYLTGINYIF